MEHLDAKLPFHFTDSTFSRGRRPVLGWKDYLVRIVVLLIQISIVLVELISTWMGTLVKTQKRRLKSA